MAVEVTFNQTVKDGANVYVADQVTTLSDQKASKFIKRGWASGTILSSVMVNMTSSYKEDTTLYSNGQSYLIPNPTGYMLIEDGFGTQGTLQFSLTIPDVTLLTNVTGVGLSDPGVETQLTPLAFTNTSASTQAANWVSVPFGVLLPKGALPNGQWPKFKVLPTNEECPATIYARRSWNDGSWRAFGAFIRVPVSVAGSATINIGIFTSGSQPSASGYTPANITGVGDVGVSLTGVTNLTGTWVSSVLQGIADANHTIVFADGDAGAIIGIGQGFMNSGSDHGQLYCKHWLQVIKGASGKLGYRYLGNVQQNFCDVTSPTATKRVFTGTVYKNTISDPIRNFDGHDTSTTVTGANIGLTHYSSFFTCGTDGKWDWIRGDGSASSDNSMSQPTFSFTYYRQAKLFPPYKTSITVTPLVTTYQYKPMGRGAITSDSPFKMETEVGLLEHLNIEYLRNQSTLGYTNMRLAGLATAHQTNSLRRSTTFAPVPLNTAPSSGGTYTGMGANQPTWRYRGAGDSTPGFVAPTANTDLWTAENQLAHRPNFAYLPWLITAEPQFLDIVVDLGNQAIGSISGGTSVVQTSPATGPYVGTPTRHITVGSTTYSGITMAASGLGRVGGWTTRDMSYAYASVPDVSPDGTALKQYFTDVANANISFAEAYMAYRSQNFIDSGIWTWQPPGSGGGFVGGENFWNMSHLHIANAMLWAISEADTDFPNYLAKHWKRVYDSDYNIAIFTAYQVAQYTRAPLQLEDVLHYTGSMGGMYLTASPTTDRFTVVGSYTPTNGDIVVFTTVDYNSGTSVTGPWGATVVSRAPIERDCERLIVLNASGATFQVATLDDPTTPLEIENEITAASNNNNGLQFRALVQDPSIVSYGTSLDANGYFMRTRGAINMLKAVGATGLDDLIAELDSRGSAINQNSQMKWSIDAQF